MDHETDWNIDLWLESDNRFSLVIKILWLIEIQQNIDWTDRNVDLWVESAYPFSCFCGLKNEITVFRVKKHKQYFN